MCYTFGNGKTERGEQNMYGKSNCEHCANYIYDEEYDCYICQVNLDEDEMARFMQKSCYDCHYFKLYDEYKMVEKQN